jgi:FkbM family methyltransferase
MLLIKNLLKLIIPRFIRERLFYVRRYVWVSGIRATLNLLFHRYLTHKTIQVLTADSKTPLLMRADTSDFPTFVQVFLNHEYSLPQTMKPGLIIDAGANVGYASVYFANRYPEARITAVEPEASNVALLRENIAPYPNINLVQAGLWHRNMLLTIGNPEDEKWLFQVKEADSDRQPVANSIEAVTINDLLAAAGADRIDILKIDIEGAEKEVFAHSQEWLDKVGMIIVELHDNLKPGCSETFYQAVAGHPFSQYNQGENVFLVREAGLT